MDIQTSAKEWGTQKVEGIKQQSELANKAIKQKELEIKVPLKSKNPKQKINSTGVPGITGLDYSVISRAQKIKEQADDKSQYSDYSDFLYKTGSNNPISNSFATVLHPIMGLFGRKSTSTYASEGAKKQALGLALRFRPKDADERLQKGEPVRWSISKDNNGDYLWKTINGGFMVHDKERSIVEKAAKSPGEFILGQYSITEHPDGSYTIDDGYNFNTSGTKYSDNIKNPTTYDKVRSTVGHYMPEDSKGYNLLWTISAKEAKGWKNRFNNLK